MKKMWARVGISFDVPEEKFQKILKERKNGKAIGVILSTCRQQFDGESYLPADTEDNPDEIDLEYLPPKESDPYKARLIQEPMEKRERDRHYRVQLRGTPAGSVINVSRQALQLLLDYYS